MKRILAALALLGLAFVTTANAQLVPFPQSLPANTVVGRTGISAGPAQAIPFSVLAPIFTTVWINVKTMGAVGDGVADDTSVFQAAFSSLAATNGGVVYVPRSTACYKITSTLTIGDGNATTQSTVHNIRLMGEGRGVGPDFSSSQSNGASCLKWSGAGGGTMLQVLGPIHNVGILDVQLDANSSAATGVEIIHSTMGEFKFTVANYTGIAIKLNTRSGFPVGVAYGNCGNQFQNIIVSNPVNSSANGILFDGDVTGGSDTCSNVFYGGDIIYGGGNGTYGMNFVYADNNSFIRTKFFPQNAGTGVDVLFTRAGGAKTAFPTENTFYSIAGTRGCGGTTGTVGGNHFFGQQVGDGFTCPSTAGISTYQTNNIWFPDPSLPLTLKTTSTPVLNLDSGTAAVTWINFRDTTPTLVGSIARSGNDVVVQSVNGLGNLVLNPTQGSSDVRIGSNGGASAQLKFMGSTSGAVNVTVQAAAGTYNFQLPTTAGAAGDTLTSGGGGAAAMTWNGATGTGLVVKQGTPTLTTPVIGVATGTSLVVTGILQTGTTVAASLPTCNAGAKAARHFVTDANATFTAGIGAVVAGGGANNVPVTCDGTNWRIG